MGSLYVVATPIGNMEDISPRAARVLASVSLIAAEDTRVASVLLRKLEITGLRLLSFNEHNRRGRIPDVLAALAEGDVALVSDAGTPAISDPGVELVAAAREAGYAVVAVPGPSSVVAALSVAGLQARSWRFVGFLPRKAGELRRLLVQASTETLVGFEAPTRLQATLAVIAGALPERRLAVCRELTKLHEEVFAGTAAQALAHFEAPRGEIVIVIEGDAQAATEAPAGGSDVTADVARDVGVMRAAGLTQAQAAALLAARYGLSRRRAYEAWLAAEE